MVDFRTKLALIEQFNGDLVYIPSDGIRHDWGLIYGETDEGQLRIRIITKQIEKLIEEMKND